MSRPLVGPALVVIGVGHLGYAAVHYPDQVGEIVRAGVLDAAEVGRPAGQYGTEAAFWYLTAGGGVVLLGRLAWEVERRSGRLPASFGWLLAGMGVWGVLLMPASGFWAFGVPAWLALRSARRGRAGSVRPGSPGATVRGGGVSV